jgi:hypothetical protein
MPMMLRDIVKEIIGAESDLRLLGAFSGSLGLTESVRRTSANVVVTTVDVATPDRVGGLLRDRPCVRVIGIDDDGVGGELHECRPHRTLIAEVSRESLVATIRGCRESGTAPRP